MKRVRGILLALLVMTVALSVALGPGASAATSCLETAVATQESAWYTPPMPRFALPRWLSGQSTPSAGTLDVPPGDRQFALYYGWPSDVNGAHGNVEAAAATFAQFQVVIFGDGVQDPSHPDYQRTVTVVGRLRELGRSRVFGYVDLGVRTQNLSLPILMQYAAAWRRIGATGIFLDDAGADFGVDQARRDAAVDGIHGQGLQVILNAHEPEDAFRGRAKLGPGDGYLFESFQVSDGRLQPADGMFAKADRALQLAAPTGADIYAVATGPLEDPGFATKFGYAWWSALLYGFAYFQYTTIDYSAANAQLAFQPRDMPDLGTRYLEERVQHSWPEGLHWRQTDRGEIRLTTGATTAGRFILRGGQ